jgi:F0F1-type ATP synthase assembly protein I
VYQSNASCNFDMPRFGTKPCSTLSDSGEVNMAKDSTDTKQAMFAAGDAVIGAAVLVGIGIFAGGWLDGKLHTGPWLTILFALTGIGLGMWRMVKKAETIGSSTASDDVFDGTTRAGDSSAAPSGTGGRQPASPAADGSDFRDGTGGRKPAPPSQESKTVRADKDLRARSAFEFLDQGDSK